MDETSPWASRRKTFILSLVVLALSAGAFAVFWRFWYGAPTCFDNLKNGDETGIDCGGSCQLVCSDNVVKPIVRWDPRLFEVSPGLWSILVYVENPNVGLDAVYVPYNFIIYGDGNQVLAERRGATILPKNRTVGIFEGSISLKEGERPRRATFELESGKIVWQENEELEDALAVTHSALLRAESAPRVEAEVKNTGTESLEDIELVAVIFDGSDNAIAASRTFIESLKKNEVSDVFFTWPRPFALGSKVCERPSDVVLLLDRSGSMASAKTSPPQPLTDSKAAAVSFIDELGGKDKIGIISFATQPKEPPEMALSSDMSLAREAVNSISIDSGSTQFTNIFEALNSARQELASPRALDSRSKVVVLLTDGVANYPKNPSGRSEADDIKYAESLALKEAQSAKADGASIYTIGLSTAVNSNFLKALASSEDKYFFAPSAAELKGIYQNISYDICQEIPARIEITYKIFGSAR